MGVEVAPMGVVLSKQDSGQSGDDGSDRGSSLKTKPTELLPRHLAVSTRDEEARDANMSKQVQIAEEVALGSPTNLKASEIHSPRHDPICPNFETDLVPSGSLTKDGGETYNNNLSTFIAKCTEALVKGAIDLLIHNSSKTIKRPCASVASMESSAIGMHALDGMCQVEVADPIAVGKAWNVVAVEGCSMDKLSFIPESQSFPVVGSSRGLNEFEEEASEVKEMGKILGCEFEDHEAFGHKHLMGIEVREASYKQRLRPRRDGGADLVQPES
ncbi:hypothetical protein MRB53_026496 [Persea americana]|uniref:Uncharacterized protein n=1 Tax=Persea americana TaxID=3435 RepID=A0ACC2LII5_PERAE|nr:hypothetical protein MRB53_026496 [Persea americana]